MEDGSADAWLSKGASSFLLHDENIVGLLPRGATGETYTATVCNRPQFLEQSH